MKGGEQSRCFGSQANRKFASPTNLALNKYPNGGMALG